MTDFDKLIERVREDIKETDKLVRQLAYRVHRLEKAIEEGKEIGNTD